MREVLTWVSDVVWLVIVIESYQDQVFFLIQFFYQRAQEFPVTMKSCSFTDQVNSKN
jgi:hypothetical protein